MLLCYFSLFSINVEKMRLDKQQIIQTFQLINSNFLYYYIIF